MDCGAITGVVLAGGRSTRMGRDKTEFVWNGQALAEHARAVLAGCFPRAVIIRDDDQPGLGPIGGLATALRRLDTEGVFVVAADMPFVDARLVRHLIGLWTDEDAVAVRHGGRYEPLHAGYRRGVAPVVQGQIAAGDYSLQRLLGKLRVRAVSEGELEAVGEWREWLRNVNTPAEWEQARRKTGDRRL